MDIVLMLKGILRCSLLTAQTSRRKAKLDRRRMKKEHTLQISAVFLEGCGVRSLRGGQLWGYLTSKPTKPETFKQMAVKPRMVATQEHCEQKHVDDGFLDHSLVNLPDLWLGK